MFVYKHRKKETNLEAAFVRLYTEIRSNEVFRDVTILYVFENNLGNEHNWLVGLMRKCQFSNVFALYEHEDRVGFRTTQLSKLLGYDILKAYTSNGGVVFYKDLITINAAHADGKLMMRALLITQIAQLKQFGKKHANGTRVRVITGIHSEDGKRLPQTDDVVMAFMMGLHAATRFHKKELPVPYAKIHMLRTKSYHHEEQLAFVNKTVRQEIDLALRKRTNLATAGMFLHARERV